MSLPIGSIFLLDLPFTDPPKPKFCVVVSIDPMLCMFLISSRINHFKQRNPALREAQLELKVSDYPGFLKHDSFLGCHETSGSPLDTDALCQAFEGDDSCYMGQLTRRDLERIADVVRNSKTLPKRRAASIVAQIEQAF